MQGEKGGTADINIGVGEMRAEEARMQAAQHNESDLDFLHGTAVSVAAVEIRGWDAQQKKEFLAAVKAHAQVQSGEDLENFAKGVLLENAAMEEILLNFEKIKMRHRASGKLFGFIPLSFSQEVEIDTEGEDIGRVKVKMPWYSFLVKTDVAASELEAEAAAAAEKDHKNWINVGSFSASQQAEVLVLVSNIIKTKFAASAQADDAASSLQGSMGF
jgi:hypothetical protein